VSDNDIDFITNLLLERETPLSLVELSHALIEKKLSDEQKLFTDRFRDVRVYRPDESYAINQKIIFPKFGHAVGTVTQTRPGANEQHGDFAVMTVAFEDDSKATRLFAARLSTPHPLSTTPVTAAELPGANTLTADDILDDQDDAIYEIVQKRLKSSSELVSLAGKWFPRSLMLNINEGHLNLAEAVLDLEGGGPMMTYEILEQMGGVGNAPEELQIFSLNYAMNQDKRFDEVGPMGAVLWYLARMEPAEVLNAPLHLRYTPIDYDPTLLTPEMRALEYEIDDELSNIELEDDEIDEATITLIYPHRRSGTFPLNAKMRSIFPTALRTPRVWVTLIDGQDDEELVGWVVREDRYVYGLSKLYRKHKLPVGAFVTIRRGEEPGTIVVDFSAYRPRTEWVRLIKPQNGQMAFEDQKRAIGAEYDALMILGTDDIAGVDAIGEQTRQQRKPLASIIRQVITELSRTSPQGTAHAKTIYSAVNVLRRSPPGPILATLISNPDFEQVGNHYWKLTSS
jgi:hypothetical protein